MAVAELPPTEAATKENLHFRDLEYESHLNLSRAIRRYGMYDLNITVLLSALYRARDSVNILFSDGTPVY
jgi:hypothetical protein